jgi:excinuclease UvrABC ATPase subunit
MAWGAQFFDPERMVLYPEASLAEGAIRGWDRRNVYYFHMLSSLAKHYDFDIDTPFEELSAKHRKIILHGSGKEEISFSYVNDRGDVFKRKHRFEGILPNMERRYRDTESQSVREDLAKFLSTAPCVTVAAAACARTRATCWWTAQSAGRSPACRWAKRKITSTALKLKAGKLHRSPTRSSRKSARAIASWWMWD